MKHHQASLRLFFGVLSHALSFTQVSDGRVAYKMDPVCLTQAQKDKGYIAVCAAEAVCDATLIQASPLVKSMNRS